MPRPSLLLSIIIVHVCRSSTCLMPDLRTATTVTSRVSSLPQRAPPSRPSGAQTATLCIRRCCIVPATPSHISAATSAATSRGLLGVPSASRRLCGRLPRSPPSRVSLPSLLLPLVRGLALPPCSLLPGPVPVCRAFPRRPWAPNHRCRRLSCRPSGRAPPPPRCATGSPPAMAPASGQRCPHRRPAGALHRGRP